MNESYRDCVSRPAAAAHEQQAAGRPSPRTGNSGAPLSWLARQRPASDSETIAAIFSLLSSLQAASRSSRVCLALPCLACERAACGRLLRPPLGTKVLALEGSPPPPQGQALELNELSTSTCLCGFARANCSQLVVCLSARHLFVCSSASLEGRDD